MIKNIVRETTIIMLIILAIILTLCVVLYDYVPTDVQVPETKIYTTSADIQEELSTDISMETPNVVLTYEISGTDLTNFEKIKEYEPGKVNPFSSYEVQNSDTDDNEGTDSNEGTEDDDNANLDNNTIDNNLNNENSSSSSNTNSTTNNSGSYFKNTGTK